MAGIRIAPARAEDRADWLAMRIALWPEGSEDEHRADIEAYSEVAQSPICLIAFGDEGNKAEASALPKQIFATTMSTAAKPRRSRSSKGSMCGPRHGAGAWRRR